MEKKTKTRVNNKKFWLFLWGLGLAGQLCWNIENQWFNTFVYAKIAKDSNIVTLMVITSALVTTFSTFLFGTLSDRIGSRRKFVSFGYIAWGIFTIAFGFTEFLQAGQVGVGAKSSIWVAFLVILIDDIMSFFGSMGNDSGFSAWSNDFTTDQNRGQIGAILAFLPVIGTIIGTVVGGLLIGSDDNYNRLFWSMGIFVIIMGVLSLLFLEDSQSIRPHKRGTFSQQLSEIFHYKGLLEQKELILVCITTALFFIPFNVYFVHMGNWMIYRMGFVPGSMGIIQGISLLLASLLVIPSIGVINRDKTPLVAFAAIFLNMIGLWILGLFIRPGTVDTENIFSLQNSLLFFAIFLAGAGYVLVVQSMTMWLKQLYPKESSGQFEGIRVLFFTLIPMIIGTIIGNIIIKNGAGSIVNEYGLVENIPTENIYLCAAILVTIPLIPLFIGAKSYYKRVKE